MLAMTGHPPVLAELQNVHKSFGGKAAVDGLSFTVRAGELVALLGPNGAGKTTAISMMLGLKRPDAGSVTLLGRSPYEAETRRGIGVMLQDGALIGELKVRELLELVSAYYPEPYPDEEVMRLTRTTPLGDRFYSKLSGGQKRMVQFALAICGRPSLMFLDEPTTGLDIEARQLLWSTIRELVARGTAVVLTTHYLEEAEALADRVVVMANGRTVASGTVEEIRNVIKRKRISCLTTIDIELIKKWPEVVGTELDPSGRLHLTVSDAEAAARRLWAADPKVSDVEIHRAGLSEAFQELTKEVEQ
jgi:ABC-2 type transport system ATP-binding protein